jgi:hypothetical protein
MLFTWIVSLLILTRIPPISFVEVGSTKQDQDHQKDSSKKELGNVIFLFLEWQKNQV